MPKLNKGQAMKVKEVYNYLDKISPFELQESWDNSGLVVGNMEDEFEEVVISLDLDLEVLKRIKQNSLILTHHPLIFKDIKRLNFNDYQSILLKELLKKDIKLISLHTNYDKTHLNKFVFSEVLGLKVEDEDDFIISASIEFKFDKFVEFIKEKLELDYIKVVKVKEKISSVSLTTGSGMGLIDRIRSDCFLTGDIKYHEAMEAKVRGINLIDIGHFESEKYFVKSIKQNLEKFLTLNKINSIIVNSENPFKYKT